MDEMASSGELLQAQAELWCHTLSYLRSAALRCAIKLGIPTAIHRCGGAASISELHAAVPSVPASKRPCLSRLMKLLAAAGIFREDDDAAAGVYRLTPVSRLLVEGGGVDGGGGGVDGGHTCLSPFAAMATSPFHFGASLRLAEWLEKEEGGVLGVAGRDAEFGALFNEAMAADSRFVAEIVVRECGGAFAGVASLVDVGGGDGTTARAIAKAFPHVRCSVLELRQVVDAVPADGTVEFVAGDMMEFIPPCDAVLLKFVLHNWSDKDCVRILKRSKEAISTGESKGKVIIIDTVLGSTSKQTYEAQLSMDLCMMVLLSGEERDEAKWQSIFVDAGFGQYKISPILGPRSLIELYP
ncbi:hypothetical protein ACP4OV_017733 [Aristida adscensionis]